MAKETIEEEIIETTWKCPTCQAVNRGRDMKCKGCGAPKDESAAYELDENAAAVTDDKQVEDANAGAHWVCAYCEKENRGRKSVCDFCGADQKRGPKEKAPKPAPKPTNWKLGCLILGGLLFAFLLLAYWVGSPDRVQAKVTALAWTQQLQLLERTDVAKEDWRDQIPAEARLGACQRLQRGTKKVVDHYVSVRKTRSVRYQKGSHQECHTETENLGNGYAKRRKVCHSEPDYGYRDESYTDQDPVYRDEPVFDDKCRFNVWEWPVKATAERKGTASTGLAWPEAAELGVATCAPCETERARPGATQCCEKVAHYKVSFDNPEEPQKKPPDYEAKSVEEFATFTEGQSRAIDVYDDHTELSEE